MWGCGGATTQQNFKAVSNLWRSVAFPMFLQHGGKKGSLDSEGGRHGKWSLDGAHQREELGSGGGSDFGTGGVLR
jgi:hypothetical protein